MPRCLAVRPPAGPAGIRLFCFHHAGAGAMTFAGWKRAVGPGVSVLPVRLPGRESRLREPRVTDGDQLIQELTEDLGEILDGPEPYAFYGHSLGAMVAYRFAEHLVRTGRRPPLMLLVGASPAPQLPSAVLDGARALRPDAPDKELLKALGDEDSLPRELLARPGWLSLTLDTLRADLRLARSLRSAPVVPLPCPVRAFAGSEDPLVSPAEVGAWAQCTTAGFRMRILPGAHFFVRGDELPRLVGEALHIESALAEAPPLGAAAS
ncbi:MULTISPECIES: alpha/beta fold hydrolase [unclassified Streptomyces]|uniref:thioesterase II family protein n=1 Tax=unclassified Streptomyces TaxID=2593676 RepID=UPI000DC7BCDE|nr:MULTISPECIES: alpha/beta fold hydrolase [unclassified Streptomyces]AWZ04427.1 thioesterase [Streptomyces sp. ICC4]AWZ12057.1 thioesterase [Streptomyces sp. ICC1]